MLDHLAVKGLGTKIGFAKKSIVQLPPGSAELGTQVELVNIDF